MKKFYRLFIGSCLCLIVNITFAQTQNRMTDSMNLVNLYSTTNGPAWVNNSNWVSATQPINTWYGVHLSTAGRVDSLKLGSNNLTGPLPSRLIDTLTMAVKIDLSNNHVTGSVPYLGNATIKILNLSRNSLSGALGYFAQGGLANLDLSYNQITGPLQDYNNFNGLVTLNLSHNTMTGSLSNQNFSTVQFFDVSYNTFSGSIPYIAGANIRTFDVSHNMFTGSINYYDNPPNLQVYNVSYNMIGGGLPYFAMPAVMQLNISHNNLTGALNYYNFPMIKIFDASSNQITGDIPYFGFSGTTGNMLIIDSNKYTFTQLEGRSGSFPAGSVYAPQDTILPIHYNIVAGKLSVSAGGTLSNNTYRWYRAGGTLAGTTNSDSTYTPTQNGMYYVLVTNAATDGLTLSSTTIMVTVPLPVTFTGVSAALVNKDRSVFAKISWQTATEINNKQFELQRSLNRTEWSTIKVINSKAVNGSSTALLSYNYEDNITPLTGVVYYRIKQVDYDGNAKFSSVVTLNKTTTYFISVAVSPNPIAAGDFKVKILTPQNEQLQVRMVNSIGMTVYTGKKINAIAGENVVEISDAARLTPGTYILQVYNSRNEVIGTVKVSK